MRGGGGRGTLGVLPLNLHLFFAILTQTLCLFVCFLYVQILLLKKNAKIQLISLNIGKKLKTRNHLDFKLI